MMISIVASAARNKTAVHAKPLVLLNAAGHPPFAGKWKTLWRIVT
jgi:hypothetical protein